MTTYFKAVRPDGGSFHNPAFKWATDAGGVTTHPAADVPRYTADGAAFYLSVSTVPTDCTGMRWPCRLLVVEPVGDLWTPDAAGLPNKRAGLSFRTVRELPATEALGPQGAQVAAVFERFATLTFDEARQLSAARDAARDVALVASRDARDARDAALDASRGASRGPVWYAARDVALVASRDARDAALDASRGASRGPVWYAARDAAWALVVRDLIGDTFTQAHYDTLTMPWRTVIGPIHPDDAAVS